MNVLFIVPYVPNLVRTRPYNLIRHLSARGNRVTVLTVWANEQEQAELAHLQEICDEVHAAPMPLWHSLLNSVLALPNRKKPLQSVYSWKPELANQLNGAASSFDVVHVEHLRGSRYGLHFKTNSTLPVVWDSVDCITHLFRQAATQSKSLKGRFRSWLDLERTAHYEGWLLDKFNHVLVTSPVDREALLGLTPAGSVPAPISVVGNGVDVEHFSPDPSVKREPATLVISGKMSYHANVTMTLHLVNEIMPHVWQQRPEAKLMIVGKDPTREIQALADHPNIEVTGTVPALPPYLQRATVAVAPITYGAGIQNKILEAMSCGTPMVTTPHAVSALCIEPGRDLLVADDSESYAQAILSILDSPEKQEVLGRNGRTYVEQYHHWPNVAGRLETIYAEAIATSMPQSSRTLGKQ
ncbi:MAG: glycosyltransferase [Ardenticatenaceae bacterium]|nr:glycosyltransferase [Anaerolineales bacterium]MCB8940816.1 glycosyltransferase [Ardenticatenaceae bacterium]MCB8972155.1 glycosyltransferase [Ardenticatenaceae bacterium]